MVYCTVGSLSYDVQYTDYHLKNNHLYSPMTAVNKERNNKTHTVTIKHSHITQCSRTVASSSAIFFANGLHNVLSQNCTRSFVRKLSFFIYSTKDRTVEKSYRAYTHWQHHATWLQYLPKSTIEYKVQRLNLWFVYMTSLQSIVQTR